MPATTCLTSPTADDLSLSLPTIWTDGGSLPASLLEVPLLEWSDLSLDWRKGGIDGRGEEEE